MKDIKDNALSIANYFVELAQGDNKDLTMLKLLKLVYIAHGHILSMLGYSLLNPRFDWVEAWRYGPVIPSVYHSFKQYRDSAITDKAVVMVGKEPDVTFEQPVLQDENARKVCKYVWITYGKYSANELVTMLHKKGTPWYYAYEENKNVKIPDSYTKRYYDVFLELQLERAKNGKNR